MARENFIKTKSINFKKIHLFDIPGVKPRTKNKKNIYQIYLKGLFLL